MQIKKIDHIGIAVRDLDSAKAFYTRAMGLKVTSEEALEGMKIAFIPVGGVNIELIQSVTDDGVIAKFISKQGEGVHHIAYEVEDVSSAVQELRAQGARVVDEVPRRGAHGKLVAFVHPKSSYGVLIELVCRKKNDAKTLT
jgi:methylmalonyl-CoA epimerase